MLDASSQIIKCIYCRRVWKLLLFACMKKDRLQCFAVSMSCKTAKLQMQGKLLEGMGLLEKMSNFHSECRIPVTVPSFERCQGTFGYFFKQ